MIRSVLLVLLVAMAAPVLAESVVYRWVDGAGITHYSQLPPESGAYERIVRRQSGAEAAAPAAAPDTRAFLDRVDADNKAAAEAEAKAKLAADEMRKKCEAARERLTFLEERTPRRLASENPDGSYSRLDEDEFERRRAATQKDVDQNCR